MQQEDTFNQFQRFLKETSGDFHVLEQRIPVEVQMEYFKFSAELRKTPLRLDELDCEKYVADLQNPESTKECKHRILSTLAISKQVKAYRILEQYVHAADPEVADWACMALMESRIILETELSDEKQIYISTGLGGKGNRLRFFILLLSASGQPFLEYQRTVVEREFAYLLPKENCEIERMTIRDAHVELVMLSPIRANIKRILDRVMNECNQYGNFLSETVTVTNVKELDDDEIARIIEEQYGNR
jgi:hypothetical protein